MGGDLNCVLSTRLDKLPTSSKPQSLLNMMKELGLVDAWRHLNPNERYFTFMSQVHGSYSRLDYFLLPKKDIYRLKNRMIESITISDHSPITMTMDLGIEPCINYWRINASLLADVKTREEIRLTLLEYFELNDNGMISPSVLRDAGRATIMGKIISIGSRSRQKVLFDS